jgi:hypothetical protein
MLKKSIILSLALLLATAIILMAMPAERQKAVPLVGGVSVQAPMTRAACTMARNDGTASSFYSGVDVGVGFFTYFDPEAECTAPAYPFEITGLTFMLHDFAGVGTATVDIVVYDMAASGLRCDGPGEELCRTTMTVTTFYPTGVTCLFPAPCCVTGPFFMGVEYPSAVVGSTPSVLMDAEPVDTCMNWMRYTDGMFYEFYDFWAVPVPGEPMFWVGGETESANCQQVDSGACCLPDGSCQLLTPSGCNQLVGNYLGDGSACLGDNNQNGTDDACETTCDCTPGDPNEDITINIGDGVYLINYIFKGGPPPTPYPLCSGDANCDCELNIGDAVYLINYIFKGGPPPCDCLTWLSICGSPLRN